MATTARPAVDPRKLPAYDNAFLGILQSEGKIELFLDATFSFLYRKTDYFRLLTDKSPNKSLGFPPGVAGKMVEHYFAKYMKLSLSAYEDAIKKIKEKEDAERVKNLPQQINYIDDKLEVKPTTDHALVQKSSPKSPPKPIEEPEPKPNQTPEKKPQAIDSGLTYNGSVTDKYKWSQNYDDIDIAIELPDVKRAKDISVDIKQFPESRLKVTVNGSVHIDSKLTRNIVAEDSTWTFDAKQHLLSINLAKNGNAWWEAILPDETPIDVQKDVKAERPMEDLPDDELAVIQKLQYDQHQKRLGKPTSDEQKVHDQLKKGWNAEGSPFKGTDFDPSKFQISGGT